VARFTQLDASHLQDHWYIIDEDLCYFLREYVRGQGYEGGDTNDLILNLKKKMDRRGRAEWKYKAHAIRQCAAELGEAINHEWLNDGTLVPVPPSKMRGDPMYDDRMTQICHAIPVNFDLDVRDL